MPEATFNDPLQNVPWGLAQQGWRAQFDGSGNVAGYIRDVPLDDSRGARQGVVGDNGGVTGDYAFEYVDAKDWNGGAPAEDAVKYQTGGTNIIQNDNVPTWAKAYIGAVLAASAGGAAAWQSGLIGPESFGGLWSSYGAGAPATAVGSGATAATNPASLFAGDIAGEATAATSPLYGAGPGASSTVAGAAGAGATGAVGSAVGNAAGAAGSTIAKEIANATGLPDWLIKLIGTAGLGGLSYLDAKNSSGPQGWQPAMDKFSGPSGLLSRSLQTPQFTTGLMGAQNAADQLNSKRYY